MRSEPATSTLPFIVRIARAIRHAPMLRTLEPVWRLLRNPFNGLLKLISRGKGLPVHIPGVGDVRVPPSFLTGEVDALEIPMLQRMVSTITPDGCFYDIGASIGLHSIVAGRQMASKGEIHAFEPDLPSCAKYWDNMELVRLRMKVQLSRTFVSDTSVTARPLALFPLELMNPAIGVRQQQARHLYLFEEGHSDAPTGAIPRVSIDAYVGAGARPPTIIKCDIEGAELLFLKGAAETIRSYKPVLFVSVHPFLVKKFGYNTQDVLDFLGFLNYTWELLNEVGECHVFATASNKA